jgi:Ca2+-binding RTX toxin-like protein
MKLFGIALVVAAVVTATAGTAAGQGSGAPTGRADKAPAGINRPKLAHGVLRVKGSNGNDTIVLGLRAGHRGTLEVVLGGGSAVFRFDRALVTKIDVDARAGDDLVSIDERNGAFTDTIPTTIDGGNGGDTIAGGKGAETLLGGGGNDSIDGNGGNDQALLGAGDDTFVWDPGDGSDTIEGQDGVDTMRFNGADLAERVVLSATGHRLTFLRDPGRITMDTAGVERVDFNALGGADSVIVDDLTATDVTGVNVDLAATLGGSTGDGQDDQVIVNGTNGDDAVQVSGDTSGVAVTRLSALVAIQHQEPSDQLAVDGHAGDDVIDASGLSAGAISLTLDGAAGDDTLAGGQGIETLLGGDGNDSVDGNKGNDLARLGAGDDTFVWDPGDGSDTVEGEDGTDTMLFNGADVADTVEVSANGSRLRFFRNPGNVTMDTAGIEQVDFNALGGADLVTINDLTGTDVGIVNVDLAGTFGGRTGDGQDDRVVVNGTNGDDAITVTGDVGGVKGGGVRVGGLAAAVGIFQSEAANDQLELNTLEGNDIVDSGGLAAGVIKLIVDGALIP